MNQEKITNRPTIFAASGFYLLAAIGLWATMYGSEFLLGLLPRGTYEQQNLLVNIVYYLPFVVLPVSLWCVSRGSAADDLRLNPISFGSMLTACIVAVLSLLIVQNVSTLWMAVCQKLGLNVFVDVYVRPENTAELMRSVIAGAMIAPIAEEILFRGVMLSAWEKRGVRKAVLVTSVLFAMLHGSLLGLPGEIFGGIMLALLVVWTDSLYAGLAFHTVYNAGAIMMNYVSSAIPEDAAAEALMHSDIIAYMGGYGTVLVLLVDILFMLALIAMFTRRMRLRYAFRRMLIASQNKDGGAPKQLFHPGQLFGEPQNIDREPLPAGTLLVLTSGIVSAIGMYVLDLTNMLGG